MLTWIREKFGKILIGAIVTFIAFVFVFYGVFSPRRTQGFHSGTVAGIVNGDAITLSEFSKALDQRMNYFKALGGGKITPEQMKAFRLREGVFQELVSRRLMLQEADRQGLVASDEEVRTKVREMPVFQKDGRFDPLHYKEVLKANNFSPGQFEKAIREDILLQQWGKYFQNRVRVSDDELRSEFLTSQEKREIKYVLLTPELLYKQVSVKPEELKAFFADPKRANLAKAQYDVRKDTEFKGQTFDQAKEKIATSILASEKTGDVQKVSEKMADQLLALLGSAGGEAKANALLKPTGGAVKSTGLIANQTRFLPGVGEAPELVADAFANPSPIDVKGGGKAKKYRSGGWWLVAAVTQSAHADLSKFEAEREKLKSNLISRKERDLQSAWLTQLTKQAKIEPNKDVINDEGGSFQVQSPMDDG